MNRTMTLLMCAGALSVAACSGADDDGNAANGATANATANSMANDPNNPFGQAEMQMHERMMAATGANASETWVKKMIEHHRGAVEMSNVLIGLGGEERVLAMARMVVTDQGKEIQELERMLQAGGLGAGTNGDADPYKQSAQTMQQRKMAATGANPSETWMRKMIEHHRGAVDMSNVLIDKGGDPKVLEKARTTARKQQQEIEHLEQMLAGKAMAGAAPAAAANAPTLEEPPKRTTTAAPVAKPEASAVKAAPKAIPKAAPKAEPKAPEPTPTCLPEHRAMGHC